MTIVVTGAGGMLGKAVVQAAKAAGLCQVIGYTHAELDITDPAALRAFNPGGGPVTIINCAGIVRSRTEVSDGVQWAVNAEGPGYLSEVTDRLVQVSTDCVFSGDPTEAPYNESSRAVPADLYGLAKWHGEFPDPPHVTVRGSFIGFDSGLLSWFLAQPGDATVIGYTDHIWTGTYVADYADALVAIAVGDLTGIVHLVAPRTTKAILLREIGDLLRPDIYVDPQRAPDGPRHLDLRSTRTGVPELPEWQSSLRRLVRDYLGQAKMERTT